MLVCLEKSAFSDKLVLEEYGMTEDAIILSEKDRGELEI